MSKNELFLKKRTNFKSTRPFNVNPWTAVLPIFLVVVVTVVMETKMVAGTRNVDLKCTSNGECEDGQICYIESGEQSGFCQGTESKETSGGAGKLLQSDDYKNDGESKGAQSQNQSQSQSGVVPDGGLRLGPGGQISSAGKNSNAGRGGGAGAGGGPRGEEKSQEIPRILVRLSDALEKAQAQFNGPNYD